MKSVLLIAAAAFSLAAQPKNLVNAKADTRSASSGLEREFKTLLTAQPQPAYIGWDVPAVRTNNLGCDYVNGWTGNGVIHLEPPDHVIVLIRVDGNVVDRIRAISPNCEIDAGDVPVHWLTDVKPAESVALLAGFLPEHDRLGDGFVTAIAMHSDPAAGQTLEKFVATNQPEWLRLRAINSFANSRGVRGIEVLKGLIANDPSERVRERAVSALSSSRLPEAIDLLVSVAREDRNSRLRQQAVSALAHKPSRKGLGAIQYAIENDPDVQVRRRAVSALVSMPDGEGIPLLIQLVKTTKDADVRKQAMNSLQGSQDSRALSFFEEVLKK
ncbi:MAG TPA: HEAT repeat domain-containing protein [Bryobacteraceae bacterium]